MGKERTRQSEGRARGGFAEMVRWQLHAGVEIWGWRVEDVCVDVGGGGGGCR